MTTLSIVAGATGYLGGAITRALRDRFHIVGLTRNPARVKPDAQHANVRWVGYEGFEREIGQIADRDLVVVDCAGKSRESVMDVTRNANFGTVRLLVQGLARVPVRKFVYFSGFGAGNPSTSTYFVSKAAAEKELIGSKIPHVILRPSYILGGNDEIFPELVREGLTTGFVEYPGSGEYRIQPLHVADVAAVIGAIAEKDAVPTGIHDLLGDTIGYKAFLDRFVALSGLPLVTRSRDLALYLREAVVRADSALSLDQLAIMVADDVGTSTETLGGIAIRDAETIVQELATYWQGIIPVPGKH